MRIVERRCNNRQEAGSWARCVHAASFLCVAWLCASSSQAQPPRFEKDVAPILRDHCIKCHGGEARKGGLDLRSVDAMTHGGDTGTALVPGKSGESLLVEQVSSRNMPPGKNSKLNEAQVAILRNWIDAGAPVDTIDKSIAATAATFWSFQPPRRSPVPPVRQTGLVRNPIDRFLLARLEANGLTYSPEATRVALVRRLYFDLWGLPPSPEQTEAFLADDRPDAWERLIDTLLASPHYGERWGRHWLDLAGYADSEGILDADYERSSAWRYRDFVIRAFNADTPYDRFLAAPDRRRRTDRLSRCLPYRKADSLPRKSRRSSQPATFDAPPTPAGPTSRTSRTRLDIITRRSKTR